MTDFLFIWVKCLSYKFKMHDFAHFQLPSVCFYTGNYSLEAISVCFMLILVFLLSSFQTYQTCCHHSLNNICKINFKTPESMSAVASVQLLVQCLRKQHAKQL